MDKQHYKIGLVLSQPPGYSETFFQSKIKGLIAQGMEVALYCQKGDDDFKLCPVIISPAVSRNPIIQGFYFLKVYLQLLLHLRAVLKYVQLELKSGTTIFQLFKQVYLNSHLLSAKLDWLHFGFATQALGSETVAKAIGAKMAVSFRGFDIAVYPRKHPGCYKKLWKYVDKVHTISTYLLREAYSLGLSKNTPFERITPAVNLDLIHSESRMEVAASEEIQIVTIARLHYIKGIDLLIEAASLLKQKSLKFSWKVIGGGTKEYQERYQYHIYEKGLQKEVLLTGKLSHKETLKLLTSANLYVQPSLNEGFCNAVLEAQAMGTLTIASNTGGLPENIVDGKTGWLFESQSAESLARQIEWVLALNVTEKSQISTDAMKRVREVFNIEKQQREFFGFYL